MYLVVYDHTYLDTQTETQRKDKSPFLISQLFSTLRGSMEKQTADWSTWQLRGVKLKCVKCECSANTCWGAYVSKQV